MGFALKRFAALALAASKLKPAPAAALREAWDLGFRSLRFIYEGQLPAWEFLGFIGFNPFPLILKPPQHEFRTMFNARSGHASFDWNIRGG